MVIVLIAFCICLFIFSLVVEVDHMLRMWEKGSGFGADESLHRCRKFTFLHTCVFRKHTTKPLPVFCTLDRVYIE